ncbi:hypothetical protein D3C80_1368800 [compost metagenome]
MPAHPHGQVAVGAGQVLADDRRQYLQQTADFRRNVELDFQVGTFFTVQIALVQLLDLFLGQVLDLICPFEILTHRKRSFFRD